MRSMIGILKEEQVRLLEAEKSYKKEIRLLPKGSLQQKHINGIDYPYLVCREGHKVVSKYLGHLSGVDLEKLCKSIEQRKKYEKLLKEVRKNLEKIRKMIRGKKRTV